MGGERIYRSSSCSKREEEGKVGEMQGKKGAMYELTGKYKRLQVIFKGRKENFIKGGKNSRGREFE